MQQPSVLSHELGHLETLNEGMRVCIDTCFECSRVCDEMISHCLSKGGEHVERNHLQHMLACAELCHTTPKFMMWNSNFHMDLCHLCSEVCRVCAEDCERWPDDESMRSCADVCRRCAKSCHDMSMSDEDRAAEIPFF